MDVERIVRLLTSTSGLEKVIRTAQYALLLIGDSRIASSTRAAQLLEVSKTLSSARTTMRQLGDLPMWAATIKHFQKQGKDSVVHALEGVVSSIFCFYFPCEHIAWLGGFGLLKANTSYWWNCCIWIWISTLLIGLIKNIYKQRLLRQQLKAVKKADDSKSEAKFLQTEIIAESYSMLSNICDLMIAVHFLPKGYLWSQTLTTWKVGAFGTLSSLIQLLNVYKRTTM